jgi:hypothetical protein
LTESAATSREKLITSEASNGTDVSPSTGELEVIPSGVVSVGEKIAST